MKPFEIQVAFTCAAEDLDAVCALEDQLIDFADSLGLHFESGFSSSLKPEELIEDSPLARSLK